MKITCRTCLKEDVKDYRHIYDVHESGELIGGILIDCTDLDISNENDYKPQHICSDCYEQLLAWLNFKAMVIKSDQYLENMALKTSLSSAKRKSLSATIVTQPGVKIKKVKVRETSPVYKLEQEKDEAPHVNIRKIKVEQETLDLCIEPLIDVKIPLHVNEGDDYCEDDYSLDHLKSEFQPLKPTSPCCMCTHVFDDRDTLLMHVTAQHAEEIERNKNKFELSNDVFECSVCLMKLSTYQRLQRHYVRYQNTLQCDQCGEIVPSFKIGNHRRTHSDLSRQRVATKRENRHQCDICKRFMQSYAAIKYHMEIHFPTMIKCPRPGCDAVRETNRAMKFHLKEHTFRDRGKNLPCPHCPQMFYGNQKARLKTHMRIHTGENPFHCPYCEKKFIDRTDWTRHQWSHTGISPYMCKFCNLMHTRKKTLVQHEALCQGHKRSAR